VGSMTTSGDLRARNMRQNRPQATHFAAIKGGVVACSGSGAFPPRRRDASRQMGLGGTCLR
jgi:hypothetical protein